LKANSQGEGNIEPSHPLDSLQTIIHKAVGQLDVGPMASQAIEGKFTDEGAHHQLEKVYWDTSCNTYIGMRN
jgi:hypothetical protein